MQAGQLSTQQLQQPAVRHQRPARHIIQRSRAHHPGLAALQRPVRHTSGLLPPCSFHDYGCFCCGYLNADRGSSPDKLLRKNNMCSPVTRASVWAPVMKPLFRVPGRRALSSPDELATGQYTHPQAHRTGHQLSGAPTPVPAATPATAARRLPGGAAAPPPRLAFPPLQPPQPQPPPGGCMLDAVTPLGPAARAGRQASDAEAQRGRWAAALRLLAEDRDENVVRTVPCVGRCMACQDPTVLTCAPATPAHINL